MMLHLNFRKTVQSKMKQTQNPNISQNITWKGYNFKICIFIQFHFIILIQFSEKKIFS